MMASTWRTLCAAMQRREAVGARSGGQGQEDFMAISAARFPCATCQGRMLPPGLELIAQQEAEQMARNTKRGKCELCGEVANVGTNHGSATCPKCTHVQAALANRLQAVAKAARAMGKAEDLIKALIPAGELAVHITADMLQEISGIVGYDGEDPGALVEAVRRMALREASSDCAACAELKGDLLMACELDLDLGTAQDWDYVVAAAIQEIARLEYRRDFWASKATRFKIEAGNLRSELLAKRGEIEELRAELTLAQQARDEWEQRAVQAEQNVETLEAELRNRDAAPAVPSLGYCCTDSGLLDIVLAVLRDEPVKAGDLATLIDAARRAA